MSVTQTATTIGRPTKYTPKLADKIITLYKSTTDTVEEICATCGIHKSTLYLWMDQHKAFSDAMTRARKTRAIALYDGLQERQEALEHYIETSEDDAREKHVRIQAARLRSDNQRFALQKGNPQLFADKRQDEVVHKIEIPLLEQAFEAHRQQLQDATANSQGDDTASSQAIDADYDVLDHEEHDVQETDTQQDTHGT